MLRDDWWRAANWMLFLLVLAVLGGAWVVGGWIAALTCTVGIVVGVLIAAVYVLGQGDLR